MHRSPSQGFEECLDKQNFKCSNLNVEDKVTQEVVHEKIVMPPNAHNVGEFNFEGKDQVAIDPGQGNMKERINVRLNPVNRA